MPAFLSATTTHQPLRTWVACRAGDKESLEREWQAHVRRFRLRMEPRAMVFMHDIEPGGGGLCVIPGLRHRL